MPIRARTALALTLLALGAAGCGEDEKDDESSAPSSSTPAEEAPKPTTDENGQPLDMKPTIEKPTGEPPTALEVQDLAEGTGAEARTGSQLTVQYVGVAFDSGKQFDASWDRGEPFPFQLGAGMVIPGWDQGLVGMKVGGRRVLTIPPELAYGEQGQGADIGPNETLVFVIDLLAVG